MLYEEFEDSKGVMRIRKSKDRQYNISYLSCAHLKVQCTQYNISGALSQI